jgi:hypothetical protein
VRNGWIGGRKDGYKGGVWVYFTSLSKIKKLKITLSFASPDFF